MELRLKHLIIFICAIFTLGLSSCEKEDEPRESSPTQTLIFYFAGTDLTFYYHRNISAIKEALRQDIKGNSRVMLFFQQTEKKRRDN